MSNPKPTRPKARLPRGFRDRSGTEIAAERAMLETIRRVYDSYGFEPLETPAFEFTDALGKFLPDVDRPNAGVFSLKDDDEQWMSLRYDLTAPLARHVATHFQTLAKPFRRYQVGSVWRNEKPGPGRFREFTQFDADTVGSANPAADAELLMMLSDTLEALGLARGDYIVKINNRKLLDGVLEASGVALDDAARRGTVLRAIDKLDRLGVEGVTALLGEGRKDESGDFTKGAGLNPDQAHRILAFVAPDAKDEEEHLNQIGTLISTSAVGAAGLNELEQIVKLLSACGYGPDRVMFDTGVVRGLDYYTGAVFEAQLTFPVQNEDGETVVFGSVAGGGRYDDLVARFTGQAVPATGVSIGVSRLLSALSARGLNQAARLPLVVVTVMDKTETANAFQMVGELRAAGLRAEAYVGNGKMGDQFKYADKRGAAIAVIEGGDERAKGEVTLKDLALGAELAKSVESRAEWTATRQAQVSVKRTDLVAQIKKIPGKRVMAVFPYYDAPAIAALNDQANALLGLFASRGYARQEPAMLQPAGLFLERSGEEIRRSTFTLGDPSGRELALRPDLTIPICKHVVESGAKLPARVSYNGLAFRHHAGQPTQFFQAGVELLGVEDRAAGDREILALTIAALREAGLKDFTIRMGDLSLFGALVDALGLPPRWTSRLKRHFWRAGYVETLLDRIAAGQETSRLPATRAGIETLLDAQGDAPSAGRTREEVIARALAEVAEDLNLDGNVTGAITKLLDISGPVDAALAQIRALLKTAGIRLDAQLVAVDARVIALKELSVDPAQVTFVAHFGRNMEYYTGFVFELWAQGAAGPVEIAGGGRYDNLLELLGADRAITAVGCAIRTEPLLAAVRGTP